ncbi:MAG TPA: hypothetical protein VIF60_04545 [Burkholderiaceae bacterium]|jgi:hypothetical protein
MTPVSVVGVTESARILAGLRGKDSFFRLPEGLFPIAGNFQ